jgi:RimJ/RimL family protein N-acetyltransferase
LSISLRAKNKGEKRNKMFTLEAEKLKLIPFNNNNFPSHRVLEKIGMQKYQEN